MSDINACEAAALLQKPDEALLLDVREAAELREVAVPGALHIPMGQIPARLAELDRNRTVICMCHLGGRSAQVAAYLRAQGFADVRNLAGGIEAWVQDGYAASARDS